MSKTKTKKPLSFGKFVIFAINLAFWFILAWIIASVMPGIFDPKTDVSLIGDGWKIGAAVLNIVMTFTMISLLGTLLGFMVKFLINSFSFSKKNWGGKILLPILGIVMILATVVIFALTLGWLIIMFKDVLFNFKDSSWLNTQLTGKYMFVSGGDLMKWMEPGLIGSLPSGFAMYITLFFFALAWAAAGIIYAMFNRVLSKKAQPEEVQQSSENAAE